MLYQYASYYSITVLRYSLPKQLIHRRVYWGFTVSEGKSKTITMESIAVGRQVGRYGSWELTSWSTAGGKGRDKWKPLSSWNSKAFPNDILPPIWLPLLILPKQFHHWGPSIQTYEPLMGHSDSNRNNKELKILIDYSCWFFKNFYIFDITL